MAHARARIVGRGSATWRVVHDHSIIRQRTVAAPRGHPLSGIRWLPNRVAQRGACHEQHSSMKVGDLTVSSQVTGVGTSSEGEFGANQWLVDELYQQYKVDKNAVDKEWWPVMEQYAAQQAQGAPAAATPAAPAPAQEAPAA